MLNYSRFQMGIDSELSLNTPKATIFTTYRFFSTPLLGTLCNRLRSLYGFLLLGNVKRLDLATRTKEHWFKSQALFVELKGHANRFYNQWFIFTSFKLKVLPTPKNSNICTKFIKTHTGFTLENIFFLVAKNRFR